MSIEVSIIIPIKNENDPYISQCLESLRQQDFAGTFEIFVIKGGNIAQARNLGIKHAQGEIIVFIDSDCMAPENWLSGIVKNLNQNTSFGGVGGANFSPKLAPTLGKAIDFVFSSYLGSLGSASLSVPSKPKEVSALACNNSAFLRKTLQKINGFDEEFELCEDTNLSYKVREAGYKLLFINDIPVWHHRRDTVKRFAKQFFRYGMGRMRSMLTNRRYASKGAIALLSLSLFFPFFIWYFPLYATFVFVFYLFLIFAIGFKAVLKTKEKRFFLLVPSLFIVEHFSYLFGLLYGVVKGRWRQTKSTCSVFNQIIVINNSSNRAIGLD